MRKNIKCPICNGCGEIPSPKKKMGNTEIKEKATILLRANGFSYREIMVFTGYKSPRSIQKILEKNNKIIHAKPEKDIITLRKSLAYETTQRIFDNEKNGKLIKALKGLMNNYTKKKGINDNEWYVFISETDFNSIKQALADFEGEKEGE